MAEVVAALDCGSNSTRLLIVNERNETLHRDSRITRLSQGVDASRTLLPEALQRSYDVLSDYRTLMNDAGVTRGLLVATSAVRDAVNGEEFLDEARRRTGVDVRILDGAEEATYSYVGATTGLAPDSRTTVIVDVGGGSTELAAKFDGVLKSYSMQLGCVRVTERALGKGVVGAVSDAAAREMIDGGTRSRLERDAGLRADLRQRPARRIGRVGLDAGPARRRFRRLRPRRGAPPPDRVGDGGTLAPATQRGVARGATWPDRGW